MFGNKKYEEEIRRLKEKNKAMSTEWENERKCFGEETWDAFYDQKVECVLGDDEIVPKKTITRFLENITEEQAKEILIRCLITLYKKGFTAEGQYKYDEGYGSLKFTFNVIDPVVTPKKNTDIIIYETGLSKTEDYKKFTYSLTDFSTNEAYAKKAIQMFNRNYLKQSVVGGKNLKELGWFNMANGTWFFV